MRTDSVWSVVGDKRKILLINRLKGFLWGWPQYIYKTNGKEKDDQLT